MLYYGFDIEDQLAVALDPANDIASATGIALGSGSEPLAYIVQAQMPLLTEFLFVDPTTDSRQPRRRLRQSILHLCLFPGHRQQRQLRGILRLPPPLRLQRAHRRRPGS